MPFMSIYEQSIRIGVLKKLDGNLYCDILLLTSRTHRSTQTTQTRTSQTQTQRKKRNIRSSRKRLSDVCWAMGGYMGSPFGGGKTVIGAAGKIASWAARPRAGVSCPRGLSGRCGILLCGPVFASVTH